MISTSENRREALELALKFVEGREVTVEDVIYISTALDSYLSSGSFPVNNGNHFSDQRSDVSAVSTTGTSGISVDGFSVAHRDSCGDLPDKTLAGQGFTHKVSSSVLADGESGDSAATGPRSNPSHEASGGQN